MKLNHLYRLGIAFILGISSTTGLFSADISGQAPDYDIYLLIGQSNMAGRGSFEAADTIQKVEGVWLLDSIGNPVEAVAPFNRYSTIRKDISLQGYSPANEFSRIMHSRTGRDILLVVNARGGSSICAWQPGDSHQYIDEAVRRTRQAMKHGTLKGILWHQGETDVLKETPDYIGKFTTMITALRDSLDAAEVPVVIGQLGQWRWAPSDKIESFNDSIVHSISRSVDNCQYVSSYRLGRLYKDKERDPHFSRDAQRELGRRYADAMVPLVDSVYVTKFRGNKPAAISFTFDDGDLDHALLVGPELEKRGYRGTFWVNGKTIESDDSLRPRMKPYQLRILSDRGHEVSNHSWSHGKLVRMTPDEARKDIEKNDSVITIYTGKRPVTFCYPYNATLPWLVEMAEEGRVGSRLHQTGIGQQNNKMTPDKLKAWVDKVVSAGDWGVGMTHGITMGYDKWDTPQDLWDLFDYVKQHDNEIWVATFREVAAYKAERDNTVVRMEPTEDGFFLSTEMPLDTSLFTEPVTVAVKGNYKDHSIRVMRNDEEVEAVCQDNLLLVEMLPTNDIVRVVVK